MNISEDVKKAARAICNYYLSKTPEPKEIDASYFDKWYGVANESIRQLGISRIEVEGDIVTIYLDRPGIFIGMKGTNIEAIGAEIDKSFGRHMEVKLIEYNLDLWLYHYDMSDEY